ncbi:hypothetical protein POM88_005531 [Heracleum sosnowskyi]|uniref:Uncharacterized protein n=1 Tax=Heracleum sosnowskyi TaxID=360622 RepID=A0AAD8J306_9APIA|nr:hypothetical protein POM88_005531 [Heracleum sosnowskyi]
MDSKNKKKKKVQRIEVIPENAPYVEDSHITVGSFADESKVATGKIIMLKLVILFYMAQVTGFKSVQEQSPRFNSLKSFLPSFAEASRSSYILSYAWMYSTL